MLLAAGFGTRLAPLTDERPKPMLPVCGASLVRWALCQGLHHGLSRHVVNLHHLGEQIRHELDGNAAPGAEITYSPEHDILGTGGGIKAMAALMPRTTCVVANAKQINDVDLSAVLAAHRASGSLATLVVRPHPNAERWGAIAVNESGRVARMLDAEAPGVPPGQAYMFTGIQVMEPELVERIPDGMTCIVRHTYMPELQQGTPISAYIHHGYFYDHSTPGRYLQGNLNLLGGKVALPHAPGPLAGVHADAGVDASASVDPGSLVGPAAQIGAGARVGPGVVIGAGATVAAGAEITDSVVWDGATISGRIHRTVVTPRSTLSVPPEDDPAASPR